MKQSKTYTSLALAVAIFSVALSFYLSPPPKNTAKSSNIAEQPTELSAMDLVSSVKSNERVVPVRNQLLQKQEQAQSEGMAVTDEAPTRSSTHRSNLKQGSPGVEPHNNDLHVRFTLHENGNGTSEGVWVETKDFKDVDEIIQAHCCKIAGAAEARCAPRSGARLISENGLRVYSFADVEENQRVYCVPQGVHFLWPLVKVGNVIYPKNVESPLQGKLIRLKQLSSSPRVFSVDNFVSPDEITELLETNKNRLTPSEVGFGGWQDATRTSHTSWDFNSQAAIDIQTRTFKILGMDVEPEIADAMQVLRYTHDGFKGHGEWYKPHVDWFDKGGYDGHDPMVDNGTNRFATMFLYLSDVEEGGATVFPLSTTHEGYNGEKIVHDGTVNTPGYINTQEARQACNTSSSALKSWPIAGNAVLFYSQGPLGQLDPYSLHGGCPPIKGTKWSANVWIWNRKRPDKSAAKDMPKGKAKKDMSGFQVVFHNRAGFDVDGYWDNQMPTDASLEDYKKSISNFFKSKNNKDKSRFVHQFKAAPGSAHPINTYEKHTFVFVEASTGRFLHYIQASSKDAKDMYAIADGIPYDIVDK